VRQQVNVWTRTDRVAAKLERAALRRDAARIAQQMGVDPETLVREEEALVTRARAAGAITREQINAYAARQLGIDPDKLQEETERLAAMRTR
jgi:hypothetical protein